MLKIDDFQNKKPNILVIGDLILDHYLWGNCNKISPEAPVQILDVEKESSILGGAGNVVNNLKALNCDVEILGVIGDDLVGEKLQNMFDSLNIKSNLIAQHGRTTPRKSRLIASNQQILRYDQESTCDISTQTQNYILETLHQNIKKYDAIILSDYGKGVLTDHLTKQIITIASLNHIRVFIDPKGGDYTKYTGAYMLTPNKKEASIATGINITDNKSLFETISKLKSTYNLQVSVITLSEDGIAVYDDDFRIKPTVAKEVYDVTGAGDTVIAAVTFALCCGANIDNAINFANLAAGVVVSKLGSATATLYEIFEYQVNLNAAYSHDSCIKNLNEIVLIANELKKKGKKIVFTNGCFDILHAGHVKYLEIAKSYADVLILGLNSDTSVKKLKGPSRPINNEEDRASILAALKSVDYVVIFDQETPYELIKSIKPHILAKGRDYEGKEIVGQDLVDEVKLVHYSIGKSTTKIIEKIVCQS